MNKYGLEFRHLGLAVRSEEKAVRFLAGLGYAVGKSLYDEQQNVNLILCRHQTMPEVELIYPANSPGPLDNILKDFSELIYHLCYSCSDLESSLGCIRAEHRIIPISSPKPAALFSGKLVSFYRIAGFGILEIIQDGAALHEVAE